MATSHNSTGDKSFPFKWQRRGTVCFSDITLISFRVALLSSTLRLLVCVPASWSVSSTGDSGFPSRKREMTCWKKKSQRRGFVQVPWMEESSLHIHWSNSSCGHRSDTAESWRCNPCPGAERQNRQKLRSRWQNYKAGAKLISNSFCSFSYIVSNRNLFGSPPIRTFLYQSRKKKKWGFILETSFS